MKKLSSYILILISATTVGGYFVYLTFSGHISPNYLSKTLIETVRHYPRLENPKEITLNCSYHGQDIEVKETLYGSVYDYYKSDPNKKSAYYHNKDVDFVFSYKEDTTIRDISSKIQAVANDKGLDKDQTLDLSACFLQGIPYDTAKAERILSPDYYKLSAEKLIARYPYETLYENIGVCTDKSYLGAAVFRELGYGVSLLSFDSQRHMSIGVKVPDGYGEFGTSYGVMELTGPNFLVGDIPEINTAAGLAVGSIGTISNATEDSSEKTISGSPLSNLSNTTAISDGAAYLRIINRTETKNQITTMQPLLKEVQIDYQTKKDNLSVLEGELTIAESAYELSPSSARYNEYRQVYNRYTTAYNLAQVAIDKYNKLVNQYNALVVKYREF